MTYALGDTGNGMFDKLGAREAHIKARPKKIPPTIVSQCFHLTVCPGDMGKNKTTTVFRRRV